MTDTLLLIEDEDLLRSELARHYRKEGWEVVEAVDLASARRQLFSDGFAPLVVLSDMSLPDGNALDLLAEARERGTASEWVFLTAYGSVADAVRALRLKSHDFVEKPCDLGRLDLVIEAAARSARGQRRIREAAERRSQAYAPEAWIGRSKSAADIREMLVRLGEAPFSALVLEGETGTGKGLAARILHASGPRRSGPMVEADCGALPSTLLESELFGYEAVAFTGAKARHRGFFEQAHGGTLFLDEIGEMDLALQAKLLTAIENRRIRRLGSEREIEVDVRLAVASHRDLARMQREGTFRQDLYHRLSVFRLALPPLREHKEDIYDVVPQFVAHFNRKAAKSVRIVPEEVWQRLLAHDWPGNFRELRNVVERSVLLAVDDTLPLHWLRLEASPAPPVKGSGEHLSLPLDGTMSLDDMDRFIIEEALKRSGWNVSAAARSLGTTRETLRYRIQKYGLEPPV